VNIIPAVDLMGGKVVRLVRGNPQLATSYERLGNPVSVAKKWEAEGARFIHIVDLDAALERGSNLNMVESIAKAVRVQLQVGGGIRSVEDARHLFSIGVKRVVLGSIAFSSPSIVEALLGEFGEECVVVALDNLEGLVMIRGWKASTKVSVSEAVERFSKMGVKLFLVTSVTQDGTLSGPDLNVLSQICRKGVSVIAAGGIGGLDDLVALKTLGIGAVVVGKALYEGRFSLNEALRTVKNPNREVG
jgi:phosphoribosylformimino-5-aminoimidazole carboxamide ribotide isomerase